MPIVSVVICNGDFEDEDELHEKEEERKSQQKHQSSFWLRRLIIMSDITAATDQPLHQGRTLTEFESQRFLGR